MAFQTISGKRFSDLVVHELDPSVGYSRKSVNVTPPAASAPIKLGQVVFRAKATPAFNNTETATFTFEDVTAAGENATITIAGRVITITDASSATAAQIAQAFITGVTVGSAAVSGTLSGYTIVAGATAAEAVFASATPNTNVTDLVATVAGDAGALTPVISQGVAGNQTYAVIADATALVNTNEFAVIYGDHYGYNPEFVPNAVVDGEFNAVGFVGHSGGLQLKEYYIKQVAQDPAGAALTDVQFEVLRELLDQQGITVLVTK